MLACITELMVSYDLLSGGDLDLKTTGLWPELCGKTLMKVHTHHLAENRSKSPSRLWFSPQLRRIKCWSSASVLKHSSSEFHSPRHMCCWWCDNKSNLIWFNRDLPMCLGCWQELCCSLIHNGVAHSYGNVFYLGGARGRARCCGPGPLWGILDKILILKSPNSYRWTYKFIKTELWERIYVCVWVRACVWF